MSNVTWNDVVTYHGTHILPLQEKTAESFGNDVFIFTPLGGTIFIGILFVCMVLFFVTQNGNLIPITALIFILGIATIPFPIGPGNSYEENKKELAEAEERFKQSMVKPYLAGGAEQTYPLKSIVKVSENEYEVTYENEQHVLEKETLIGELIRKDKGDSTITFKIVQEEVSTLFKESYLYEKGTKYDVVFIYNGERE